MAFQPESNCTEENVKKEHTFEDAVKRLEEIVGQLEDGEIPLDDSLTLFEEGVKLSRFCRTKLDEAEKRISLLLKDEGGVMQREAFTLSAEDDLTDTDR
jgi:exodeoxyribonuclease VII small subunit